MDIGLSAISRTWLPTLPATLRTSLLAGLGLTEITDEEADRRIEEGMRWRVDLEERLVRKWRTSQKLGGRFS